MAGDPRATGGRGADVCIDYSGRREALQQALRGVACLGEENVKLGVRFPGN